MVKYYIKRAGLPFLYLLFMIMPALGILAIGDNLLWLKIVLGTLAVALYCVVVAMACYKEGQDAVKVRAANDLERMVIVRTGENRPLKIHEEYKPHKGFIMGLFTVIPLLFLAALHTLLYLTAGVRWAGAAMVLLYLVFFEFFMMDAVVGDGATESVSETPWYEMYGALIAVPIIILVAGISYIVGARKILRQQEMIKAKQREIYGE